MFDELCLDLVILDTTMDPSTSAGVIEELNLRLAGEHESTNGSNNEDGNGSDEFVDKVRGKLVI